LKSIRSLCVFCGSRPGRDPRHMEAARTLGRLVAESGIRLVFGGGRAGMMGAVADAALAAGGAVTGVIPQHLIRTEHGHGGVTELLVVDSMHARKQRMFELSDAFAVLPGGIGTLDEAFEIVTWKQLGIHDKPIVIVDIAGYWQRFDTLIAELVAEGFAGEQTRGLYTVADGVGDLFNAIARQPEPRMTPDTAKL
jgi:uncharacterized protein (TIGR00730 family)